MVYLLMTGCSGGLSSGNRAVGDAGNGTLDGTTDGKGGSAAGPSAGSGGVGASASAGFGGDQGTGGGGSAANGCVARQAGEWQLTSTLGEPPPNALNNSEIVLWSGQAVFVFRHDSDGGKYDPCTDSWSRFGAYRNFNSLLVTSDAGAYVVQPSNPSSMPQFSFFDFAKLSWTQLSVAGYPIAADTGGAAVLVESRIVRWGGTVSGGFPYSVLTNGGAVYDVNADHWTPMSSVGAPAERVIDGNVIAAGKQIFVWGGARVGGRSGTIQADDPTAAALTKSPGLECPNWEPDYCSYADGALYDPAADRWTPVTQTGAPSARFHAAIAWTGSRVLVWGGTQYTLSSQDSVTSRYLTDGALYDPSKNSWTPMAAMPPLPANAVPSGIWSNGHLRMTYAASLTNATDYLYDPGRDVWEAAQPDPGPPKRTDAPMYPTVIWTGTSWFAIGGFRAGATPPNPCQNVPGCDPPGPELIPVSEAAVALPTP